MNKKYLIPLMIALILLLRVQAVFSKDASGPVLTQAAMCERIENFRPVHPAVVFTISQGEVFCFTEFDRVTEKTDIFHRWYKKDKLIFTMKLTLSPPRWSSFSRIQIREADKGPWRVEIRDQSGTLYQTLRFSMAD